MKTKKKEIKNGFFSDRIQFQNFRDGTPCQCYFYPDASEIKEDYINDTDIPVLLSLHGMGGNENSWQSGQLLNVSLERQILSLLCHQLI